MKQVVQRLVLGVALVLGAAGILLVSDLGSRVGAVARDTAKPRVALLEHASQAVLQDGVRGILAGLAEGGFEPTRNLDLRRYNSEGDLATANTIARGMVSGDADLLVTVSTPSLQAVANANRDIRRPHVFALVTDPSATGVGISKDDPMEHPGWMAGYGTMQPIEPALRLAREVKPDLRRVGVVFNAAEVNAVAQVRVVRAVCEQLGIALEEATVDNSSGVGEATGALTARGSEAIFLIGDVTVLVAAETVIQTAGRSDVPVFTVIPPHARKGAIFDLGADYFEVGRKAGVLAAEVLKGRDPATVPIVNYMPESLVVNEQAVARFSSRGWSVPESVRARAGLLIDRDGQEHARNTRTPPTTRSRPMHIEIIGYSESLPLEETLAGLRKGMKEWPWKEGEDFTVRVRNAQGDMGALNGIVEAAMAARPDVLVPLSTPALQAAFQKARDQKIVFAMVANPMAAGAAKSYDDHPPHLTGVTVLAPAGELLDLIRRHYPGVRRIGTLYCPAEANSVDLRDILLAEARHRGMEVETVAVATPGELADAAMSLAGKPIDAIVQISDNLSSGGFTAVTRAARQAGKPLFSLNSTTIPLGAAVAVGRDYEAGGEAAAALVRRVLEGESPAGISIQPAPRVTKAASIPNAQALGMTLPDGLLGEMEKVIKE
ncbi:MAG: ABC transporter substrate-binding protein [Terrimicrobiaceae bacterium]|nr:ABC transporter substrate-binding protein [Terrimicrobiaceae bacterium]